MQQQQRFFHWLRHSLALLLLLPVGLSLAAAPAQAATITVTTTADSGAGSLRQAINAAASGDTITFALPNPSTITLNSQLVIAKNLTIQGPGAAALTISGPATNLTAPTRLFFINPGATGATSGPPATNPIVTIANLTLANGKAQGTSGNFISPICCINMGGGGGGGAGMGGAIFSNRSQLTIRGVTFSANRAQGGTSGSNTTPSGNAAGFGGGGMGSPSVYGPYYGVDGGSLGGNGGKGADGGLQGPYPNGGVGPIGYPGGDGAGGGGGYPNKPGPGGVGGFGGGGGGGGGMSSSYYGTTGGPGGAGGFGGGGGGGGGVYGGGGVSMGGAGGQFGGRGGRGGMSLLKGAPGGGGAGLGGAIFIRAGALTLIDSSFLNNSATGGQGFSEVFADPGQGKGGAIFILTFYNNQSTGASLTMSGCATFSGNSAANAAGSAGDNHDIYGNRLTALPLCSSGSVAGAAVAAANTGAVDAAQPLTVTALEAAPVVTESVPVSVPVVEVAPVVTESLPVSVPVVEPAPVVAEAPAVTTTQNVTPGDAGVVPVDANATDATDQNQRLFLPIITNLAGAALRSPGGIATLVLVVLVVVGGLVRRRRRRTNA